MGCLTQPVRTVLCETRQKGNLQPRLGARWLMRFETIVQNFGTRGICLVLVAACFKTSLYSKSFSSRVMTKSFHCSHSIDLFPMLHLTCDDYGTRADTDRLYSEIRFTSIYNVQHSLHCNHLHGVSVSLAFSYEFVSTKTPSFVYRILQNDKPSLKASDPSVQTSSSSWQASSATRGLLQVPSQASILEERASVLVVEP
jgi:hypothetical protein